MKGHSGSVSLPSRGSKVQRKRKKNASPSKKSLAALGEIIDAHKWVGMITLRFPDGFVYKSERWLVKKLMKQFEDRLRADQLIHKIGFVIKREFGKKGQLHYHIGITSICGRPLLEAELDATVELHRKNFLRLVGQNNNQGRYFHIRLCQGSEECSKLADYLKKEYKHGVSVVALSCGWKSASCARFYHSRGLSHMPRGGRKPSEIDGVVTPKGRLESDVDTIASVPPTITTNWSGSGSEGEESCPSQNANGSISPVSTDQGGAILDKKSTRSSSWGKADPAQKFTLFTKENPHVSIRDQLNKSTRFVELVTCATCEHFDIVTVKRDDSTTCHKCGKEWHVCHPF